MKYYISDLHLGHFNVLKFDKRPFKTLEEMDSTIISNWNSTVTPNDEVYLLGDCVWDKERWDIIRNLNGKKFLIKGNHDRISPETRKIFVTVDDYKEIKDGDIKVILCHYPIASWNGMTRGSVHLYGHVHNGAEKQILLPAAQKFEQRFDIMYSAYNVGCMLDYMNYTPRTLEEILNNGERG